MSELSEAEWIKKYPFIKTDEYYGFNLRPGWVAIFEDVCQKLAAYNEVAEVKCNITQVKEKFGELRIYIDNANDYIYNLVGNAGVLSVKTCAVCGAEGKLRPGSWIKSLCDKHYTPKD